MSENRIRELRLKKKLSQRELAKRAQTSQQQVQRIEAGVQAARFDLAARLSAALGEPLERVFPAVQLPLRRAEERHPTLVDALNDPTTSDELEEAGLDMDASPWTVRYRLRGGAEGALSISGPERSRLWGALQRDEDVGFIVLDAGNRRYAFNAAHLTFCQFLFDAPPVGHDEEEGEQERWEAHVFLSDNPKPLSFSVDPDTVALDEEEDPPARSVQLQDLFFYAENGTRARLKLTDEDGETAFFRASDVAMFSVPLEAVVPKLLAADEGDEDAPGPTPA